MSRFSQTRCVARGLAAIPLIILTGCVANTPNAQVGGGQCFVRDPRINTPEYKWLDTEVEADLPTDADRIAHQKGILAREALRARVGKACEAVLQHLQQNCDSASLACEPRFAPSSGLSSPEWKELDPKQNRDLLHNLIAGSYGVLGDERVQREWSRIKEALDDSKRSKHVRLRSAHFDLFNRGAEDTVYAISMQECAGLTIQMDPLLIPADALAARKDGRAPIGPTISNAPQHIIRYDNVTYLLNWKGDYFNLSEIVSLPPNVGDKFTRCEIRPTGK